MHALLPRYRRRPSFCTVLSSPPILQVSYGTTERIRHIYTISPHPLPPPPAYTVTYGCTKTMSTDLYDSSPLCLMPRDHDWNQTIPLLVDHYFCRTGKYTSHRDRPSIETTCSFGYFPEVEKKSACFLNLMRVVWGTCSFVVDGPLCSLKFCEAQYARVHIFLSITVAPYLSRVPFFSLAIAKDIGSFYHALDEINGELTRYGLNFFFVHVRGGASFIMFPLCGSTPLRRSCARVHRKTGLRAERGSDVERSSV